jgi:hypothetical protein
MTAAGIRDRASGIRLRVLAAQLLGADKKVIQEHSALSSSLSFSPPSRHGQGFSSFELETCPPLGGLASWLLGVEKKGLKKH